MKQRLHGWRNIALYPAQNYKPTPLPLFEAIRHICQGRVAVVVVVYILRLPAAGQ